MIIPFWQVDAFADRPFTGNSAAVMLLDSWLNDAVLQAIAAENNLAETAFLVPATGDADFELRWFTPVVEVAMCGHATLASGHILLTRNNGERVRFGTGQVGVLEVRRARTGYELDLPAWSMERKDVPDVARLVGGSATASYWRDGGYVLLVYESEAEVLALTPDFRALAALDPGDILYVATAPGSERDIVSRVFAPGAGIDEDPVTGSAHALLTPYWAERLGRDTFSACQASPRRGYLTCRLAGHRVVLGGQCVTVIEGGFRLG